MHRTGPAHALFYIIDVVPVINEVNEVNHQSATTEHTFHFYETSSCDLCLEYTPSNNCRCCFRRKESCWCTELTEMRPPWHFVVMYSSPGVYWNRTSQSAANDMAIQKVNHYIFFLKKPNFWFWLNSDKQLKYMSYNWLHVASVRVKPTTSGYSLKKAMMEYLLQTQFYSFPKHGHRRTPCVWFS